ncbi:TPA: N-acetylmuramoyl-L-alanine amidase family protein [Streptococcus pneumoniae]|uniref:Ltp family lipoprotein n=1 Tax=Streptococcus pneumoniae TaxID=1313 RepID=UPI000A06E398|nr:Ltp family lipoprotein [Streptococcus pneumoniae]HEU7547918.1 N-acetylmuramoyl-L-alanine amidase family protein [Streptococcus pneumoniae]HEV4578722.1 N-acetylmuramoyl-L-alanine amidase family protein [Streptococcus pneumoniae]HEV4610145.1 N-acetylmuramoyl-L-alanine amidase family protein [Streptococcus pneumoniae]HEV4897212.1 N-acetylmuramoyl-L-alanine amidase family protein [Streptococcus pneumoniae]
MSTIDTSGVLPFSAQTVQADTQTLTPMAKYYIILPKDAEIYKTWRGTVNIPIIDATKTTPELSYFKEDHRNYIANENKSGANYIEWKGTVEEFKETIKKLTDKKSTTATPKKDEKPKPTPTVQSGWVGSSYYQDGKKVISKWIFDKKYNSYFYLDASGNYVQNAWVGNYYLKSGGYMAKGEWVYDSSYQAWYYLKSDGSYARNAWQGNYYLKSDGKMAKGEWVYDATYQAWYYLTSDGSYAYSTWQGNYYLKSDGKMAVNEWVDGGRYYVGADGVWKEGQASTASSSNDSNSEYSAALGKAKSYNSLFHMSKKRMYRQLTSDFDKFSNDAAQYAIDH